MRKLGFLLTVLCFISTSTFAQESSVRELGSYYLLQNEKQLNVDVGLLNTTEFALSLFGASGSGEPSPSINLSFDYGLTDNVRIGAFTGYYRVDGSKSSPIDNVVSELENLNLGIDINSILSQFGLDDILCQLLGNCPETVIEERVNVFTIGGKLMLSRPLAEKIDTYASTYLGYSFNKRKTITEEALGAASEQLGLNTEIPSVIYYASAGARFYVTPLIGIYGEYGYGNVHLLKLGLSYKL